MSREKPAAPDFHPAPETQTHAAVVSRIDGSREQLLALSKKCTDRADSWSAAEVSGHPYPSICRGIETMLRDLADDIRNVATDPKWIGAGEGKP